MNKTKNTSPAGELGTIARRLAVAGAVTLACLGATAQEAYADNHGDLGVRPYVGIGMEYLSVDYSVPSGAVVLIEDQYLMFDLHFGAKMGDWFGAEVGVFQSATAEKDTSLGGGVIATEADLRGFYLDLLGYFPITPEGPEIIGSIGISRVAFDQDVFGTVPGGTVVFGASGKATESVMRYGLAIQHHITENFALKAAYRRHDADNFTGVDYANSFHAGVNYHF